MKRSEILRRLNVIEKMRGTFKPDDEDSFFKSLGVDGKAFDFDVEAALSALAMEDWKENNENE